MRMMMKVRMDTATASRSIADGTLPKVMTQTMERLRPEAAYFGPEHGHRTAFIVFDLDDPSRLPPITEPLFGTLGATVDIFPVMDQTDLQKGLEELTAGGAVTAG